MESYTRSFHLQTGLNFGAGSFSTESSSKPSKIKQRSGLNFGIKSTSYGGEGTFDEILAYNKHLTALKDLEELKEQYYDEYLENLERKVLKQRKLAKKAEEEKNEQADLDTKKTLPAIKKLPYHQLKHDKEYLRNVSKSRFYHLLAARDLMERKGLIKTKSDEESFWDKVLNDNELWRHPVPDLPPQTMTRVMMSRFTSVSRLRKMHGLQGRDRRVTFNESPTKGFPVAINSLEAEEESDTSRDVKLLKFKVKLKLPKLHSMKNITPPLPPTDIDSAKNIQDSYKKLKRLRKLNTIQRAYDVSMVNHAATKQMLKSHGLLTDQDSKFLLQDVVASTHIPLPSHQSSRIKLAPSRGKDKQVFITEPVYGNDQVLIPDLEYKYPHENLSARKRVKETEKTPSSNENKAKILDQDEDTIKPKYNNAPTPLSFNMMVSQGELKVKEAKCSSSLWVNYTN